MRSDELVDLLATNAGRTRRGGATLRHFAADRSDRCDALDGRRLRHQPRPPRCCRHGAFPGKACFSALHLDRRYPACPPRKARSGRLAGHGRTLHPRVDRRPGHRRYRSASGSPDPGTRTIVEDLPVQHPSAFPSGVRPHPCGCKGTGADPFADDRGRSRTARELYRNGCSLLSLP